MNKRHAFTLVEMLVVMAIIGIVAAMVVTGAKVAAVKKRQTVVEAGKQQLMHLIESYQSKLNYFPPDNGALASNAASPASYEMLSATNPLLYELTGGTNNITNGTIQLIDNITAYSAATFQTVFNRAAVANAFSDEAPHNFMSPGPKPTEYASYVSSPLSGLIVPVAAGGPNGTTVITNFWHYDSSTTNRHNASTYDLWAEYISDNKGGSNIITTNGNW